MSDHILTDITARAGFRQWLVTNHATAEACWVKVSKRGSTPTEGVLWYLDAVEEALCFGWIDSVHKRIDGIDMQRFTPRRKGSVWSELNKERCRRLERSGLMTDAGRAVLPDLSPEAFTIAPDIQAAFEAHPAAWHNFLAMPPLYQRVRIDTIQRDRTDMQVFRQRLDKLIAASEQGRLIGAWNDYGRLSELGEE